MTTPTPDFDPDELARIFTDTTGEAQSDGGLVTAAVDATGRISNIWLDPKVTQVTAERLAEALTTVCGQAFDNRIDQLTETLDDFHREHHLPPELFDYLHNAITRQHRPQPTESAPPDDPDIAGIEG